jgi:transposase-like protein
LAGLRTAWSEHGLSFFTPHAAEDVLAHLHFPREHRRRLHSTNPLERLHKEIKRRTRVVGIFPTRDSLMRMVGTLLAQAGRRVAGDGGATSASGR